VTVQSHFYGELTPAQRAQARAYLKLGLKWPPKRAQPPTPKDRED